MHDEKDRIDERSVNWQLEPKQDFETYLDFTVVTGHWNQPILMVGVV